MSTTLRHLRHSLIVLATIVGASLAASETSACTTMARGDRACVTVCGCCTTKTNDVPANGVNVAVELVSPTVVIPQVPAGCATSSPGGACSCRSQEPVAPTPKPSRTTAEGRTELSPGSACVPFGDDSATRIQLALQVPAVQNPPKTPLYLRNERLLF
ncbi:hypothetical protein SAMN05444166_5525 [Singulisphaera sp. GP187]|uniref:hypothetical protein n=1 Tax=Singulisphaera sp. GP187 TaxID=1882752 RepID=UPI00092B2361|nr:hypothetical protein [Singulisphaera sp. GP187]SIO57925.1 hypothetical protein SAMN05444166_5525 [Singulisphaera sp. GP187]